MATDPQKQYDDLKRRRATTRAQLSKFRSYVENFDSSNRANFTQLKLRMERTETLWERFEEIQGAIEALDSSAEFVSKQDQERTTFEDTFYQIMTQARMLTNQDTQTQRGHRVTIDEESTNVHHVGESSVGNVGTVRLPTMNLPTFNGTFEQWPAFYGPFSALVDKNTNLSNLQKFYYLLSSLSTTAKKTIESLEITEGNYANALDLLKKRYDNSRLATRHHIRAIFELKPIAKESAAALRDLTDEMQQRLAALTALKEPTEHWNTIINEWILSKLDSVTSREWEEKAIKEKLHRTRDLLAFLEAKCSLLESMASVNKTGNNDKKSSVKSQKGSSHVITDNKVECKLCKGNHKLYACETFHNMPIESRRDEVKKLRLCFNYLNGGHTVKYCKARHCKVARCQERHHSLLHTDVQTNVDKIPVQAQSGINESMKFHLAACSSQINDSVILSTALVKIKDNSGNWCEARALLDSGATPNFITADFCKKIGLPQVNSVHAVLGFNGRVTTTNAYVETLMRSRLNSYERSVRLIVTDSITCPIPESHISLRDIQIPDTISLSNFADPRFNVSKPIDLLLGSGIFWPLLRNRRIQLNDSQPVFQDSFLGWIIGGAITGVTSRHFQVNCCSTRDDTLTQQLQKFWDLEKCETKILTSSEERACEEHFVATVRRDDTGRYEVSLSFKDNPSKLGDSLTVALKRLKSLERRFNKNDELQISYGHFMRDYQNLHHMSLVGELSSEVDTGNLLPHHGVCKTLGEHVKLRVIFDASCVTTSGKSLNDLLMVGPTIQQELVDILARFRQHPYVVTADISQMYRQILIKSEDRRWQRILWREQPDQPVSIYELNTVTYGTSSAPFLAIRCLHHLAEENQQNYPETTTVLKRDFYVDDMLTGSTTVTELSRLKNEITSILASAGMKLHKWQSNVSEIARSTADPNRLLASDEHKTLGLRWDPIKDDFVYQINLPTEERMTKRKILSLIAQIYDPLGLVSPITLRAKIIMQMLWKLKIEWDSSLPNHIQLLWNQYKQQLDDMPRIHIPRGVLRNSYVRLELHGFSDASQTAYGAAVYVCYTRADGTREANLLCSKSRIAPPKALSIPRLELCGAVLSANLVHKMLQALTLQFNEVVYWTDSTIVLHWINKDSTHWKVFVGNRVSEIQSLSKKGQWRHVDSSNNPADLITRGVEPKKLVSSSLWWTGPSWLKLSESHWPERLIPDDTDSTEAKRKKTVLTALITFDLIHRFSTLNRLRRVTAFVLRFVNNTRCPERDRIKTM